jgi:hypothetical protein
MLISIAATSWHLAAIEKTMVKVERCSAVKTTDIMTSNQTNLGNKLCSKPEHFVLTYFRIWTLKSHGDKTYTISAALSALTAFAVPIWKTTLPLSCGQVWKTTFSVPFSKKSIVPRDSGKHDATWLGYMESCNANLRNLNNIRNKINLGNEKVTSELASLISVHKVNLTITLYCENLLYTSHLRNIFPTISLLE